jgi:hypothetical protein
MNSNTTTTASLPSLRQTHSLSSVVATLLARLLARQPLHKLLHLNRPTVVHVHLREQPAQITLRKLSHRELGIFPDSTSELIVAQITTVIAIVVAKELGPVDATNSERRCFEF